MDCKNALLKDITNVLFDVLGEEDVDTIDNCVNGIVCVLSKYTIDKQVTAVVIPENPNIKILKRYTANLVLTGMSKGTIYQYQRTLINFAREVNVKLIDAKKYDVLLYMALLKKRGVGNRSIGTHLTHLTVFFKWCKSEGLLTDVPTDSIKQPKYQKKIKTVFSSVDIYQMRYACKNNKERAVLELLLSTGVRAAELCAFNIKDIDFVNRIAYVIKGKGNKDRRVYFSPLAAKHLANYLNERKDTCEALFINNRLKRITTGGVTSIVKRIAGRCGVSGCHPHKFRRTLATSLSNRGMDINEISRILGHENINTTMGYIVINDSSVSASYERFSS